MYAPIRILPRALALPLALPLALVLPLVLPLLAACNEAPVSPTPVADHTIRNTTPAKGTPDHSADIAATTGEILFLGPTGTAGASLALPLRGPAPDIDGIVAAARTQLAAMPRPSDARLAARVDAAESLLGAHDATSMHRILSADAPSLARTQSVQRTTLDGSRVTSVYRLGGTDLLRLRIENAPTRRVGGPLVQGPNLGYVTPIGPDDPCMDLAGDPAYWPAECVPGYDPSFDPTQVANDVASMYASLSSANADVAAIEGDPRTNGQCSSLKAAYYSTVGSFVWSAAQTLFWGFRKNPAQAWTWAQRSFATLMAVNVANVRLRECVSREL